MSSERSLKIFNTVQDLLGNQGRRIEPADGLIWKLINDAQDDFTINLRSTRIQIEYPLFADKSKYPIDDRVIMISDISFLGGDGLEHTQLTRWDVKYPRQGTTDTRVIEILDMTKVSDYDDMRVLAFVKARENEVISADKSPMIQPVFDSLIVDHVLSNYREVKKSFKPLEDVLALARQRISRLYGVNRSSLKGITYTGSRF